MTAVKEKAYAKVNLYLDVVGKRNDGFHNIKTVMHSVSLFDDITVSVSPSRQTSVNLLIEGNKFLPTDTKNLAYRAAILFLEKLGKCAEVHIKLKKFIPVSAGLAGGSSDAAAVLRALNKLYKRPFTIKALCSIAAELGSDVPYCIIGKTVLCEGRGEIMHRIPVKLSLNFVIANSGEHVSTPEAYADLDKKYSDFDGSVKTSAVEHFDRLMREIKDGKISQESMYNIFESVVFEKCPKSEKAKKELLDSGAKIVMMSGSGPSIFGIFENAESANKAKEKIISKGYRAFIAHSV